MIKKFFYESFLPEFPFSSVICHRQNSLFKRKFILKKSSIKFSVNNFKTTSINQKHLALESKGEHRNIALNLLFF